LEKPIAIKLRSDILPPHLQVLHFEPDRVLKLSLRIPFLRRVWGLVVYLAAASLLSSALVSFVGRFWIFALALALYVWVSRRGTVLSIDLSNLKYRVSSPLCWYSVGGVPSIKLETTKIDDHYVSTLSILDDPVVEASSVDKEQSEKPFADFVSAFAQAANAAAALTALNASQLLDGNSQNDLGGCSRSTGIPLVILVHGTAGKRSSWAIPDQSEFVTMLREKLSREAEFIKFPWSGANRTRARADAAVRLATRIASELSVCRRPIFVVAHSHGGNVALRALSLLPEPHRADVRTILLSTPFLSPAKGFDIEAVHAALPESIREDLAGTCKVAFWFASLTVFSFLQVAFLNEKNHIPVFGGSFPLWQLPLSVFVIALPIVLFNFVWKQVATSLARRPNDAASGDAAF
jgi:pimeloyl-ACP methyl ester carboxylesterase